MDQFIVVMSRGLIVRRHQAGCLAQDIRLYSDDGCHSIRWEPPKVSIYDSQNTFAPQRYML